MIAWLLLLAVALVAAVAMSFYLLQHKIVFAPHYYPHRSIFLEHASRYRMQSLPVSPSVVLEGMVYEPEGEARATVLYFGGREQDSVALIGKFSLHYPNVRFIAFNYRGYGKSGGRPSCTMLYEDALQIYDVMHDTYGDIGVLGYSLGTSVAALLGARRQPRWVVLVNAFCSVETLLKERLKMVPGLLVRCKCDTQAFVSEMVCPLYLFASKDDEIVPLSHFEGLRESARNLAEAKEFSGYNHASLLFSEELEAELTKVFGQ